MFHLTRLGFYKASWRVKILQHKEDFHRKHFCFTPDNGVIVFCVRGSFLISEEILPVSINPPWLRLSPVPLCRRDSFSEGFNRGFHLDIRTRCSAFLFLAAYRKQGADVCSLKLNSMEPQIRRYSSHTSPIPAQIKTKKSERSAF